MPVSSEPAETCVGYITDEAAIDHAREMLGDDELVERTTRIFGALADNTRFRILASLATSELCVCDLQEICGVSQSAIAHQLRLLRERHLVTSRRDGQRAVYSLVDEHVRSLVEQGIQHASHI